MVLPPKERWADTCSDAERLHRKRLTSTIPRTYGPTTTSVQVITRTVPPTTSSKPADVDVSVPTYTEIRYWYTAPPSNLGATVGGAVGGFAVLSITGFGIFFVRRKIKKDRARQAAALTEAHIVDEKIGKGDVIYNQVAQSELPDQSVAEMSQPLQELDGSSIRHETSASPIEARRPPIERRASL